MTPWALCFAVLMGPAVLVWIVRATAFFAGCTPGPGVCRGMPIGAGLRDTLALSWVTGTSGFWLITISVVATLAAFRACRPMTGTLTLLVLPILSPILPIIAVLTARDESCTISSDGIGNCQLWGAAMGMSFHNAAIARDVVFAIVPYTVSLSVMLGILGFFFARPKAPPVSHSSAHMHHYDDEERFG